MTGRPPWLDELDAAWLTNALHSAGFGAVEIAEFDCAPIGNGQTSTAVRFELSYSQPVSNAAGRPAPMSLIGKLPSGNVMTRSFAVQQGMYLREVDFYRRLCSRVTIRVPACYLADMDTDGAGFVLLLEDMGAAVVGDQLEGCSVELARAALEELVGLHVPTWCDALLREAPWMRDRGPSADYEQLQQSYRVLMPEFLVRFGGNLEPAERDLFIQLGKSRTLPASRPFTDVFSAVHFDYRLDNLLFGAGQQAGEVTVLDWQTVRIGEPLTDVSYFLGGSMTTEVRRTVEEDLVRSYHQAICAAGVEDFSWADCWESYRRAAFHGFFMAVFVSVYIERTERNSALLAVGAQRHARHALDLGAAEFLD